MNHRLLSPKLIFYSSVFLLTSIIFALVKNPNMLELQVENKRGVLERKRAKCVRKRAEGGEGDPAWGQRRLEAGQPLQLSPSSTWCLFLPPSTGSEGAFL